MPIIDETGYNPSLLLTNRHLSTIIPNLLRFTFGVNYQRQRVLTADGDFLDLDWSKVGSEKIIILSHGLESNSRSTYILGMVKHFNNLGYDALAWNFRSCSGEMNWTQGFYHPGQTDDLQLVIDAAMEQGNYKEVYLIGFSLGGALTLRYLGEKAHGLQKEIQKAVVFSVPTDLHASALHLSEGSQSIYARAFLLKYRRKMQQKEKMMPGTYDLAAWDQIKTLMDFDEAFSAPWTGMENAEAFYNAFTAKPVIPHIQVPTLIVNAMNDPFLPPACFPCEEARNSEHLYLEVPEMGGHVGFMTVSRSGVYWSEARTQQFLEG